MTPGLLLALTPELFFALTPGLPLALTLGLPLGPQPCNPFCLGRKPKARVATIFLAESFGELLPIPLP